MKKGTIEKGTIVNCHYCDKPIWFDDDEYCKFCDRCGRTVLKK